VQRAKRCRDDQLSPAAKAEVNFKTTSTDFLNRKKTLKGKVKVGIKMAGEAKLAPEKAKEIEAEAAMNTAKAKKEAVQVMETQMRVAESEWKLVDKSGVGNRAWTRDQLDAAVARWDEWRRAHPSDVVDPKPEPTVGVFSRISELVGGGGGSTGSETEAAKASPVDFATATRKALTVIVNRQKNKYLLAVKERELADKRREAAMKEGECAKEELEVSGPMKVEQAKAAAKKEDDVLAAAEAELALVSEAGPMNPKP